MTTIVVCLVAAAALATVFLAVWAARPAPTPPTRLLVQQRRCPIDGELVADDFPLAPIEHRTHSAHEVDRWARSILAADVDERSP